MILWLFVLRYDISIWVFLFLKAIHVLYTDSSQQKRNNYFHIRIWEEIDLFTIQDEGDDPKNITNTGNQEAASDQKSGRTRNHEVDSVTLTPGECLAGTGLRSLTLEDTVNNIRSKILYKAFGPPLELSYDSGESHKPKIALSS